ncbi:MAG: benzoate/H(+) symporter BenE family transporter [Vibrio sp.]|uniref:benzoate/H(+) symporter BenE family transporter n=1 Tax=Vibrio sp. TaxID=678 RepID=UPI003A89AD34
MQKGWFNLSHVSAGFTAVLVGYTSSVVIIIQAATAAGATSSQIESWLLALGVAMGVTSILFSWFFKKPVLTAWSTPGAAMLVAAVGQYEMQVVIGAFVISGLLIVLTGLISPLSKALANIPPQLATAMLGAILLSFCVKIFSPVMTNPNIFFVMFAAFLIGKRFLPQYTMAILLAVGIACSIVSGAFDNQNITLNFAKPEWISPNFELSAMINLSLPLYIITMLSQNLPGIAMMRSHAYEVPVKPLLLGTGAANILFAPFGGFSVNLAAISAAICMNKDADEDPAQRYKAVICAGVFYLIAGIWATTVVAIFLALPKKVTQILAGLALLGTLLMCFQTAFKDESVRESALYTFLITMSGVTFLGISSVVWGLAAGLLHIRFMVKKSS